MKGGVAVSRYINYECLMTFLYIQAVCLALCSGISILHVWPGLTENSPRGVAASVNYIKLLRSDGMSSRMGVLG